MTMDSFESGRPTTPSLVDFEPHAKPPARDLRRFRPLTRVKGRIPTILGPYTVRWKSDRRQGICERIEDVPEIAQSYVEHVRAQKRTDATR